MGRGEAVGARDQTRLWAVREVGNEGFNGVGVARRACDHFNAGGLGDRCHGLHEVPRKGPSLRIERHAYAGEIGEKLLQQLQPFATNRELERGKARDVAAGMRKTFDKALSDRVTHDEKNDRNRDSGMTASRKSKRAVGDDETRRKLD
jgi:hypothetical protein